MDNRLLIGVVAVLAGVLVLIWPEFLRVVVGVILILGGLMYALQGSGPRNNI